MKIELRLEDDIELRSYIKQLIQNEVINIARKQIVNTVTEVLDRKLKGDSTYSTNIDKLIEKTIISEVAIRLGNKWDIKSNEFLTNLLKQLIVKELNTRLVELTSNITANIINTLKQ